MYSDDSDYDRYECAFSEMSSLVDDIHDKICYCSEPTTNENGPRYGEFLDISEDHWLELKNLRKLYRASGGNPSDELHRKIAQLKRKINRNHSEFMSYFTRTQPTELSAEIPD